MKRPKLISEILDLPSSNGNYSVLESNVKAIWEYITAELDKDPNWVGYEYLTYSHVNSELYVTYPQTILSTNGEVFREDNGEWVSREIQYYGFKYYTIYEKNKNICYTVHRSVGSTFIPLKDHQQTQGIPMRDLDINHKNGIKQNNHVLNLEWGVRADKVQHVFPNGISKEMKEEVQNAKE